MSMSLKEFLTPDDQWGLRAWVTLALLSLLPLGLTILLLTRAGVL
jgi:hypothetical protein